MKRAYVYVIWNLKGGVGKTTTAVNLAYNFSLKGRKVLVMELDPQVNATPFFAKANEFQKNIYTLMQRPELVKSSVYRSKYPDIDLIRGSGKLEDASCPEGCIGEIVARIRETCDYDIILIDCRTSYENLTYNALQTADAVLTPVILDGYCRDNLAKVGEVTGQLADTEWLVFANKVKNGKAQRKIFEDLMQRHTYPFLETCVVERAAVDNALDLRKPLMRHAPKNQVSLDFMDLAEELLARREG